MERVVRLLLAVVLLRRGGVVRELAARGGTTEGQVPVMELAGAQEMATHPYHSARSFIPGSRAGTSGESYSASSVLRE